VQTSLRMADSNDETKVLPHKSQKRPPSPGSDLDPARRVRFLTSRPKASRASSNAAFAEEMENVEEPASPIHPSEYGYLPHIQSFKPSLTPDDKSLPQKVR
jgi:hypothetical protein